MVKIISQELKKILEILEVGNTKTLFKTPTIGNHMGQGRANCEETWR